MPRLLVAALAALSIAGAAWAEAGQARVDAHAEIAAALYAASATQAAVERAADVTIVAQRAQIVALASKVRAGQARAAELAAAQEAFVAQLAAKDRAYAQAIASFRGAVTHITETPEGAEALAKFNAGDEVGALAIISQLNDARDAALQRATDVQKAVGRRDQAQLALDARDRGKVSTSVVIGLYEQVVRLDPGVNWDWVELTRLYRDAGRLPDARHAAEMTAQTVSDDRDRSIALTEMAPSTGVAIPIMRRQLRANRARVTAHWEMCASLSHLGEEMRKALSQTCLPHLGEGDRGAVEGAWGRAPN